MLFCSLSSLSLTYNHACFMLKKIQTLNSSSTGYRHFETTASPRFMFCEHDSKCFLKSACRRTRTMTNEVECMTKLVGEGHCVAWQVRVPIFGDSDGLDPGHGLWRRMPARADNHVSSREMPENLAFPLLKFSVNPGIGMCEPLCGGHVRRQNSARQKRD